jgi:hypothetical protein
MSGNLARKRMTKFMPADFKLIETRQPPLKDLYDEWLARIICYAFSVPASAFVTQVNRATSETLRLQATQEGLVPLKAWVKSALDYVIQVCMNEPGLEFVWVGDDAIDPLQQAQTLQILVSAGIKTREEARAELGLGGAAPAGPVGKYNHNHDEQGRFTTADNAAAPAGSPTRKPRPHGVQVASLNNIAIEATVDGGTADQAAVAQMSLDAGVDGTPANKPSTANTSPDDAVPQTPSQTAQSNGMIIIHEVPYDAVSLTTSDGTQFYAPPDTDFRNVYAAGRANGRDLEAVSSAVGTAGTYDFQRKDGYFYSAYQDASNYAVGVYMADAGYSYSDTIVMGIAYSMKNASNWESGLEYHVNWWTRGWNDATNGSWPISHP